MNKQQCRLKYKKQRQLYHDDDIIALSKQIYLNLTNLSIIDKYTYFHIYCTSQKLREVQTDDLITFLSDKDKIIMTSKTHYEKNEMPPYYIDKNTVFEYDNHSIPNPIYVPKADITQIEVCILPLLIFDKKGNRVGYGKGLYDRFLSKCSGLKLKIGLCFFNPEDTISDIKVHDQPLDMVITPQSVFQF